MFRVEAAVNFSYSDFVLTFS